MIYSLKSGKEKKGDHIRPTRSFMAFKAEDGVREIGRGKRKSGASKEEYNPIELCYIWKFAKFLTPDYP